MIDPKYKLEVLKVQAMESMAYVNYWIGYANTPMNLARTIHKGLSDGPLMTKDELIDHAFKTASNHIARLRDIQEAIIELGQEEEKRKLGIIQ